LPWKATFFSEVLASIVLPAWILECLLEVIIGLADRRGEKRMEKRIGAIFITTAGPSRSDGSMVRKRMKVTVKPVLKQSQGMLAKRKNRGCCTPQTTLLCVVIVVCLYLW